MKTLNKVRLIISTVTISASLAVQAYPGESIVLDPVTGNYTITYWDDITYGDTPFEQPSLRNTTFIPATKIIPAIRSKFQLDETGFVSYSYTIFNGVGAKQSIVGLSLQQTERIKGEQNIPPLTAPVSEVERAFLANMQAVIDPVNWHGGIYSITGRPSNVAWRPSSLETGGVQAGRSLSGFGYTSPALPGVSMARMEGIGGVFGYAGEGPAKDSAILSELKWLRNNDFVPRHAAAPMIAVPSPFDAAVTLERIQANTHTWIGMKLLDATFSSQLDRSLTAAANAYRHNQNKAGKEHLQAVRLLLKKAYTDLENQDIVDEETGNNQGAQFKNGMIARLAARVLDFNVKYVLKRLDEK